MNLEQLGYTKKWIEFKVLNRLILNDQIDEYKNGGDQNVEDYRYYTLMNWLESKKKLTEKEVHRFLTLAKEDPNTEMAGAAVKKLFTAPQLTEDQYETVKLCLPEFGEWTEKVIRREDLWRKLKNEKLTFDLYRICLKYKRKYNDNRMLVSIIEMTDNEEILMDFETNEVGKRIRTLANKKLNKVRREKNKKS